MSASARLYMDEVIRPRASLSKRGFVILLAVLAAYNAAIAAFLFAIGAFPVPIFLGLDFLAVIVAFNVSYGRAKLAERIQVSAEQVRVLHQAGAVSRTIWTSPTAFTQVSLVTRGRHDALVRLHLSGKGMTIAAALGPKERRALAGMLEEAIRSARLERYAPEPT